jgi:hypothetical protein
MAMRTLRTMVETGQVCRSLRAKTLFYHVDQPQDVEENSVEHVAYSGLSGPFWCALTQTIHGPDGKFVTIETCSANCGRGCCETA